MRKIPERNYTVWSTKRRLWVTGLCFVTMLYIVFGVNWLSPGDPRISDSLEESKDRGVFLKEVRFSKDSIRVWDSLYVFIKNSWIELPWYNGRLAIPHTIKMTDDRRHYTLCMTLYFRNELERQMVRDSIAYHIYSQDSSIVLRSSNTPALGMFECKLSSNKTRLIVHSYKPHSYTERDKELRDGIDTIEVEWGQIPKKRKWYQLFSD